MLTTIIKTIDTFLNIATTSSSVTLSLTGFRFLVIPISSSIACGLTIIIKIMYEIVKQKYFLYKKQYEEDQKTIKSFDKIYRKSLQDNVVDEKNMNLYVIFLLKFWMNQKMNPSYKYERENKISSFCKNKLKFNLEPRSFLCDYV